MRNTKYEIFDNIISRLEAILIIGVKIVQRREEPNSREVEIWYGSSSF